MGRLKELREKNRREEERHNEIVRGLINALLMAINKHQKINPTLTAQDVVNAISFLTYLIYEKPKKERLVTNAK